jgi:UDP-GlcNAc:undecaprenyl-phosphate GlcNAc-1-phosphate transferase
MPFAAVYFALPLLITIATLLAAVRLFPGWGLVDRPIATSMHHEPMPTMAGIVMGGVFFLCAGIGQYAAPPAGTDSAGVALFLFWVALFFILGVVDDLIRIPSLFKLPPYVLLALVIAFSGFRFSNIPLPWMGDVPLAFPFDYLFTLVWFVVIINAINITDGLDGLLGIYTFIYFLSFALICLLAGALWGAAIALLMVAVSLGFLFFNLPPARIFMGNTGSHFIGVVIAFSPLTSGGSSGPSFFLLPAALLAVYPIMDLTWSFVRRWLKDRNPFGKDTLHLYHIVRRVTGSTGQTLIFFVIIFSAGLCLAVIGTQFAPTEQFLLLVFYLIALVSLFAAVVRHDQRTQEPLTPDGGAES